MTAMHSLASVIGIVLRNLEQARARELFIAHGHCVPSRDTMPMGYKQQRYGLITV